MSLLDIQEFVKDKNILLVGNNLSALEKEQGKFIDSFDIVLRFGKGLPDGREVYLGSRTDIWVTGGFRKTMRKYLPNATKVLYNSSTFGRSKEPELPDYEYTEMYTLKEIDEINSHYGQIGNKRLSAGAITAHWLFYKVKTFKTMSLINFDFFHETTKFKDTRHDIANVASSWHLPLAIPDFVLTTDTPELHPAHDLLVEKRLFTELLSHENVKFHGELPDTPKFVDVQNAAWDSTRQKL